MFKVNNKDTRATPMTPFWSLYCWLWKYFTLSSSVSNVNLEQVNAGWVTWKFLANRNMQKLKRWSSFVKSNKLISEAAVQRCSVNKVFLEISQNSQENTCARVSFLITHLLSFEFDILVGMLSSRKFLQVNIWFFLL